MMQRERVLLYLYGKSVKEVDGFVFATSELTQDGIAKSLGIGRSNLPRVLIPLIKEGYVKEWKARVNGYTQRRKVYTLTPRGLLKAKEIMSEI